MLKLLTYDIKSLGRSYLYRIALVLILSLVGGFVIKSLASQPLNGLVYLNQYGEPIVGPAYVWLFIAVLVLWFSLLALMEVTLIKRLRQRFYGAEKILFSSLSVPRYQLYLSPIFSALFALFVTGLGLVLSLMLFFIPSLGLRPFFQILPHLAEEFSVLGHGLWLYPLLALLILVVTYLILFIKQHLAQKKM